MNWLQKTAQLLSTSFTLDTPKIGAMFVEMQCSFEDYHQWYEYKHGPEGWNDSQTKDSEAMNRAIEKEPNVRLHISHQFSEAMPRVNRPKRSIEERNEMDAFDIVGDQMTNLENDDFYETIKIKDVGETIRSWLFKPIQGFVRADPNDRELQNELSTQIFNALEELQQQYWAQI